MVFPDGWGFHYESGNVHYINAVPEHNDLLKLVGSFAAQAQLDHTDLGPDIRTQRTGNYRVAFNYGSEPLDLHKHLGPSFGFTKDTRPAVGSDILMPADVAVWVVD